MAKPTTLPSLTNRTYTSEDFAALETVWAKTQHQRSIIRAALRIAERVMSDIGAEAFRTAMLAYYGDQITSEEGIASIRAALLSDDPS